MNTVLDRRGLIGGAIGLGVAALSPVRANAQGKFAGRQLVSQGAGGATQDAIQKAMFDRLDHDLGCKSTQVPLLSAAAFARMRAEAAAPQIDMYLFSGGQEATAAAEGLTAELVPLANWDDIPANMKDPQRQWAKFAVIAEGILYRTDKVKTPPRSYKDFLDPAYAGHIAFPTIANGYGTDFLVMLARAFGGSETNIEPGFTAMAKFAAQATIFKAAAEVPGLFAQSDIWIMPYDSTSAKRCKDAGLPVAFVSAEEGSPASFLTTCIAKKSKNIDLALAAVDSFLSVDTQTLIAQSLQWAPTNSKIHLPEDLARQLPRPDQLITLDMAVMTDNRPRWTERWNKEIGHP